MTIPPELISYFSPSDFENYPLIKIPQIFNDDRGSIINLADGALGDVAIIHSKKNAIRANHYHRDDWHLCYLLEGKFQYEWFSIEDKNLFSTTILPGELIFTPKLVAHRLQFLEPSKFITISKLSRITDKYESDTVRLLDFIGNHN
jgi:dTDP-4-dehydrorhamnose 3,5-epimerase-like enzyme